ncbi:MAG TPA: cysteine hydrolase family protein [Solirubrobacteraceae bacterium]
MSDLDTAALLVIDVQRAFDDAAEWGRRNNPDCERNVAALVAEWQAAGRPIVLVRHDSDEPGSSLAPGADGNAFKPLLDGVEGDLLVAKRVNSAFYGDPDLHAWLQERGIGTLVLCGIQTNHCVETTARMGGNLGYDVRFVLDATHTFDRTGPDGTTLSADELARATATSLHGEFATVVSTRDVVGVPA